MEIIIALVFIFLIVKLLFSSNNSGRINNSRRNSYSNWNDDTYCERDSESSSGFDLGDLFGDGDSESSYDSDECDSYEYDSEDDSSDDCSEFSDDESDESDECDSDDESDECDSEDDG